MLDPIGDISKWGRATSQDKDIAIIDGGWNMPFIPEALRPDPVDDPSTRRPSPTDEQYRWLERQGYSTTQIEDMIIKNVVNDYLPLAVQPQFSPLEKARELKRFGTEESDKEEDLKPRTIEVKNEYSVMNSTVLKRALNQHSLADAVGRLETIIVDTIKEELKAPEVILEVAKDLVDRVVQIKINPNYADYRTDDETGDHLPDHPGRLNKFMDTVTKNGGEIISVMPTSDSRVLLYYKIPESIEIYIDNSQGM